MKRFLSILALIIFIVVGANAQGLKPIQVFDKQAKSTAMLPAQMLEFDKSTLGQFVNKSSRAVAPKKAKATLEGWTSVGQETFTDGALISLFGGTAKSYKIEVLQNNVNPNLYRLVDPFGTSHPSYSDMSSNGFTHYDGAYIDIDVSNPTSVVVAETKIGWFPSEAPTDTIKVSGTGSVSNGVVSFPSLTIKNNNFTQSGSISIELSCLKWSAWEPFAPGGENLASYTFDAWKKKVQDSIEVFVRTSASNPNDKQIKVASWGAGIFCTDGVDLIIDWNAATDSCKVSLQSTGYYMSNYTAYAYVMDMPTFYSGITYKDYPCTYNPETGVFSLYLGYTIPSYVGTGQGFGYGTEYLRMFGMKDYSITGYSMGNLVEDMATGKAVQWWSVESPNSTKFRGTVIPSSAFSKLADLDSIARSLTGDYVNSDSLSGTITGGQGVYYILTASYNDEGTYKDFEYEYFFYSPTKNWNILGMGTITDDILTGYSSYFSNVTTPVEIQENKANPGIYRIKNPYGSNYPYSVVASVREDCYIYVNAMNANAVALANPWLGGSFGAYQPLGIDFGFGEFGAQQLSNSASARTYGWLKNDSITFPKNGLGVSVNQAGIYYANLNGKFCITLPNTLDRKIYDAVKGKKMGNDAVVDLEEGKEYELYGAANAGLVNLTINGNGAVVKPEAKGQITTMQQLVLNDINFDCTKSTVAPVGLDATPDSAVSAKYNSFYASIRTNVFYDTLGVYIYGCNFSDLKTSLFTANKAPWSLTDLVLDKVVAQFNYTGGDPIINFHGNTKNEGALKNFIVSNSTLYNIVESNNNYFIRFANASNGQASKAYPGDPYEYITFTNNTFVNMPSNINFGNNTQNNNSFIDSIKGNVFYNTYRLQKYIQSNNVKHFTNADNAICGITNAVDAGDTKNIATEDTLLCKGDAPMTTPTTALDFANIDALKANFTPCKKSYACQNGLGDPRWKQEIPKAKIYFAQDYESGAAIDWVTNVSDRFTPEIGESTDGNHYMRAAGNRAKNATGIYSNAYKDSLVAGTPFTMTADIHLRSANNQNGAEFVVGAAGASYNFSKWTLAGKMTLSIAQVKTAATEQWILNGDTDNPITLPGTASLAGTDMATVYDAAPWYTIQLSWKDGMTFFSIKDKATDSVIVDKRQLKTNDNYASVGGVGQLWFATSRYNAAFAIDNVVIREIIDGDLPVIIPTTYTINYVHDGDMAVLKNPVVVKTTVGTEVTASSSDMASFFNDDKSMKYIYKSGNDTLIAQEDSAQNIINLVYRDAQEYKYTVKSKGLPTGVEFDFTPYVPGKKYALGWEGETASVAYPEFVFVGDSLWYCPAGKYVAKTFNKEWVLTAPAMETVEYTDNYTIMDVTAGSKFNRLKDIVYYKEGEEIFPNDTCTAPNQYVRCSYGKAGAPALNTMAEITTLPAGTYRVGLQVAQATTAAQKETFDLFIGTDTLFKATLYGYVMSYSTPEFTITDSTKLYLKGLTVDGAGLDWLYVQKVNRIPANLQIINELTLMGIGTKDTLSWTTESTETPVFSSDNNDVATVGTIGDVEAIGKGAAKFTVIVPQTNYVMADTAYIDVVVNEFYANHPAISEGAYFFWKSIASEDTCYGGSIVCTDSARYNKSETPGGTYTRYYVLSVNGKNDFTSDYFTVNLDQALATGDTIVITAFRYKDNDTKKANVRFDFNGTFVDDGTDGFFYTNLYSNPTGEPSTHKMVVPSSGNGLTTFRITRANTGTNSNIVQLEIVKGQEPTGIEEINTEGINFADGVYNLRGQKVDNVVKGQIYIANGQKFMAK